MSRYYLHVRDGASEIRDLDGGHYTDGAHLETAAVASARELMGIWVRGGVLDLRFRIDAEDEQGNVIYSLPFAKAARIIGG